MKEHQIRREIQKAINLDGRARLVRNPVGFDPVTSTRYGLGVGSADLVGMLRTGRVFALEVKTARKGSAPSDEQRAWLASVRRFGGFAAVVRSPAEAVAALERALEGALE